ncbi:FERM domain-containing protein 8-like isoform X2 [Homarus americanus]|uniref:FERM domain-containing protein 8-like isoform X2 n=1 Tax=Homarus americanus TaxID=6706 RepID=UPI001C44D5A9|nr:FERM domain-containing protein 8-like isoform X2 [Homarus americanus]
MEGEKSSTNDSLPGSLLSQVSRKSSMISRVSRRSSEASSISTTSSNINIDDLSLLSESFPARLWQRWIGLPMPLGKMSDYGFEEDDSGGLGGHQTDAGQNYITVIPVEYPTRRPYPDYDAFPRSATISRRPRGETDAFPRSATISREFLRERAAADFLRGDYKGSADHLDKTAGFYPGLPPPAFDVPSLSLDPETRRPSTHMMATPPQTTTAPTNLPSHTLPTTTTSVTHPSVPQPISHTEDFDKANNKSDHERKSNKGRSSGGVEVCVFLHSRVAVRLRLDDGARITAQELQAMVIEEEDVSLPKQAMEVFAIWMVSPVLEIQLKPYQRALEVRRQWGELLKRFAQISIKPQDARYAHEPKMVLRRNVFFSKRDEVKIRDAKILELLYEEAQWNMRSARYPCELSDYEMLAGIQSRLELGPYDHTTHTPSFFRRRLLDYLPEHACRLKFSDLVSFSSKSTPEIRIIEQFRSIPSNVTARKLVRKYLEFSWSLPYYGSAFFHGQIEQPTRGVSSWLPRPDIPVLVTINATGVTVIDPNKSNVLLSLRYDELSWDFARPSNERSATCLPCLFLQFAVVENGRRYSKLLQIFSKQAIMMDALISTFVEELKRRAAQYPDDLEGHMLDHGTEIDDVLVPLSTVSRKEVPESVLCNKLHRLSLATFTEDGRCVGTMGSWQFSR